MNYFELFNLPIQLVVNKNTLTTRYFELSKKYHPDYFAQASEADQFTALETSAALNQALTVLKQPIETIKYVLQLKGVLQPDEKYQLPADFLMEMMQIQEQLAEAQMGEGADNFLQIDKLTREVEELSLRIYTPVKDIIEQYADATVTEDALMQLKAYYYQKKYLVRIMNQLKVKP